MTPRNKRTLLLTAAAIFATFTSYKALQPDPFVTASPLRADAAVGGEIALVDAPLSLDNLADGWVHRRFFRVTPTTYETTQKDGRDALRCATDNAASILIRDTDISLAQFPLLRWDWMITQELVSEIDEDTHEGDDHPARFFVRFIDGDGGVTATEIIWSNTQYSPGDYKVIDDFQHLVANGLSENTGVWHSEVVDLLALYRHVTGRNDVGKIDLLGFFCDSDNTGGSTEAFFADVRVAQQ